MRRKGSKEPQVRRRRHLQMVPPPWAIGGAFGQEATGEGAHSRGRVGPEREEELGRLRGTCVSVGEHIALTETEVMPVKRGRAERDLERR